MAKEPESHVAKEPEGKRARENETEPREGKEAKTLGVQAPKSPTSQD